MILNTRPAFYGERFHDAFAPLGHDLVDCPVLTPLPSGAPIPHADGFEAVIFTSQIAVSFFPKDEAWLKKTVYAVGPLTGKAAREVGFADVTVTGFNADDLKKAIATASFTRALYPSARDVASDLELAFPGRVRREETYMMVPRRSLPEQVMRSIGAGDEVIAPLFSRRSADVLAGLLNTAGVRADDAQIAAVGASAKVLDGIPGPWRRRAVASEPTLDAVVIATRSLLNGQGGRP